MNEDYLLIATDTNSKFVIRFLCLRHAVKKSYELHKIPSNLQTTFGGFLINSVLLGSLADEQESTLYKLKFTHCPININCEVSPSGLFRSAVFPIDQKDKFTDNISGELCIIKLYKNNKFYESVIQIEPDEITNTFRSNLKLSEQKESLLLSHCDLQNHKDFYGLWINKLPETSSADWDFFLNSFNNQNFFLNSFKDSSDPDKITQKLFPKNIKILAVTKPKLNCSCNKEMIMRGLSVLPKKDLVEIFMDGKGIETQCDYCHKTWTVSDHEISDMVKAGKPIQ